LRSNVQDSDDEDEDVTVDARHYSIYSLNTLQFAMRNSVDQKANYCALEGHLGPIVGANATDNHSHLRGSRRQTIVRCGGALRHHSGCQCHR